MNWILLGGSFFLGTAGALMMSRLAPALGFLDLPNSRSSHLFPTPRGGGLGILLAASFSAMLLGIPLLFWLPAILLGLVSLGDDRLGLSPVCRLCLQISVAISTLPALAPTGAGLGWYLTMGLFWAFFLVMTANFFNFMDGINGMAGISGAVGFALLGLFAYLNNAEIWHLFFPFALSAACLGFLPFNIPRPKVFLGDVGSVLIGFLFAALVALQAKTPAQFLVLTGCLLPIYADAIVTIIFRWNRGENILRAHRQHVYQVLVHEHGHPHWRISLVYGLVQLAFGLLLICGEMTFGVWFPALVLFPAVIGFVIFSIGARNGSLAGGGTPVSPGALRPENE